MNYMILTGDCLDLMQSMEDGSIDSIVTDPPYGLGFMGKEWDHAVPGVDVWKQCLRVLKPGGHMLAFAGTRTQHRMACAIEDAGFEIRDLIAWMYGSGFPKSHNGEWGGTALKPAMEPITLARKPIDGTVAQNWGKHGTGALNIDDCRIQTAETLRVGSGGIPCRHDENVPRGRSLEASSENRYAKNGGTDFAMKPGPRGGDVSGRWPANIIHDGSPEVISLFPANAGGYAPVSGREPSMASVGEITGKRARVASKFHGDSGSAARFFYCAKASRSDRNAGCDNFEEKPLHWSSGDKNPGSFQSDGTNKASRNNHPTVKPTDLMRYLCRLVTPHGGTILDPFMGSGSTGRGAILEGFKFIGYEISHDYVEIAKARIAEAVSQRNDELAIAAEADRQGDLFSALEEVE